jgi:hypothetical protein
MIRTRYDAFLRSVWLAVALVGLLAVSAPAQPPPVLGTPDPQAPTLNMPAPMGVQRGTSLELTLTGTNLADPVQLWTTFPGRVTIPSDQNNGKDNGRLRVRLEMPSDAPLGFHAIRLVTRRGISNLRLFCIDDLPQVQEVETNHTPATAQAVPVPGVVAGRADAEVSDYFKIRVKAGQRLSFDLLGHRLGSAFDPQLSVLDPRSGRELAYSNDAPGLQTDPRLTYTFKEAGDYVIEIRDVMYRGGGDFYYRLRIGDFPCATTPVPMAARRGSKVQVGFAGSEVEGVAPVEVTVPTDPAMNTVWVAPRAANGLHGWPVALAISDVDEVVELEPNNEPAAANRVPVPGGVTGRFLEKGDVDHFLFAAKKGQHLLIEAHTHDLYSPTEVYMTLKDAKGGQLAATNPMAAPQIDFTAPADGDYTLSVEHLNYWSGPAETYHVTLLPAEPGFRLALGLDRYGVPPGAVTAIPVYATRQGYAGPIDVEVTGPAGLTGQATIPAGQPAAPNQPGATLYLHARPDLAPGAYLVRIVGKAMVNGKLVTTPASVRVALRQALADLTYPPRDLVTQVAVGVTEKPPFVLTAKLDHPEAARGVPASLTVTAQRMLGFGDEIALAPAALPPNVAPMLKNIPKGQNEVKVQLTPAANVPLGTFAVVLTGKAKFQNRDYAVTAAPLSFVVGLPLALQVEPAVLKLTPGGKGTIKVQATRKGGYQGPIALELKNLPANVTAAKATIPMGKDSVGIEVFATAKATPVEKKDVQVQGTATAAGNQQQVSPNFAVAVTKK